MTERAKVSDMALSENKDQIKFSVTKQRKATYMKAAKKMHLRDLSAFVYMAVEEKLQRDFPDFFKEAE